MTASKIDVAMSTLQTLMTLASGVSAVIGGVSSPIVGGFAVAQALLPVVSQFIIDIGDKQVMMDVSTITTEQVVKVMKEDIASGWPVLSFK